MDITKVWVEPYPSLEAGGSPIPLRLRAVPDVVGVSKCTWGVPLPLPLMLILT